MTNHTPAPFLTAQWKNLLFVNYEIDPEILLPFLPHGVELDAYDGKCLVSLVGFQFFRTKVLGCIIPFHRDFEEVNLRFYVRRKVDGTWRRGVVFIKEIVPLRAVAWVANQLFKENYVRRKMAHYIRTYPQTIATAYSWKDKGILQSMAALSGNQPQYLVPGSKEHFITEHYWGYIKINKSISYEYEVLHPQWQCYPVVAADVAVDFDKAYGADFAVLNRAEPDSVMLANGSEITTVWYRVL